MCVAGWDVWMRGVVPWFARKVLWQSLMKFSFLVFFSVFDSLKRVFIDCRCLVAGIKMRTGRKEYEFESGGLLILHAPNVPCSVAAGVEGLEGKFLLLG